MPNHTTAAPISAAPRTISFERAIEEGVSPRSLRDVAKWNVKYSKRERGPTRERLLGQADELSATAAKLEAANDNRRRGA